MIRGIPAPHPPGAPPARPNGILPFCGQEREPGLPSSNCSSLSTGKPYRQGCDTGRVLFGLRLQPQICHSHNQPRAYVSIERASRQEPHLS